MLKQPGEDGFSVAKGRGGYGETYRLDDSVDHFDTSCNLVLTISNDQAMQILFRIVGELVRASFTLLDTPFATNANLGPALPLHLLQTVATGTYKQTEEVDFGKLLDRDVDLLRRSLRSLLLVVLDGRAVVRIVLHRLLHQTDALFFELFTIANFSSVGSATLGIIGRGRRRGTE